MARTESSKSSMETAAVILSVAEPPGGYIIIDLLEGDGHLTLDDGELAAGAHFVRRGPAGGREES